MAKKAFIALLFLIAISGIAPPTHATATNVKGAEAATTPRKLVEKFQDQTVVEEVMIKLPQQVRVPNGRFCYPFKYDQCDPGCDCVYLAFPFPGNCVCPCDPGCKCYPVSESPCTTLCVGTCSPKKMVGNFQDETVKKEKLIKLPQRVGTTLSDTCGPDCTCYPISSSPCQNFVLVPAHRHEMKKKEMKRYRSLHRYRNYGVCFPCNIPVCVFVFNLVVVLL